MTVPVIQYIWRGCNLAPENSVAGIFKIGISQNTKCDILVSLPKSGHIYRNEAEGVVGAIPRKVWISIFCKA